MHYAISFMSVKCNNNNNKLYYFYIIILLYYSVKCVFQFSVAYCNVKKISFSFSNHSQISFLLFAFLFIIILYVLFFVFNIVARQDYFHDCITFFQG